MSLSNLRYRFHDGYVDHWLLAGPKRIPLKNGKRKESVALSQQKRENIFRRYHSEDPQFEFPIAEGNKLYKEDDSLVWRILDCQEDHLIDLSTKCCVPSYLKSWAYFNLVAPRAQIAQLIPRGSGPIDIWVNGEHIARRDSFSGYNHRAESCSCHLLKGKNNVLVRFEQIGIENLPHFMGLRVAGLAEEVSLALPTAINQLQRRRLLSAIFNQAYVDRKVYGREDVITLHWPDSMQETSEITIRLQDLKNRIYVEARPRVRGSDSVEVARGGEMPEGHIEAVLMPPFHEYYVEDLRIRRCIRLEIVKQAYTDVPYGSYEQRRREALEYAADREDDLYGQIARMELGRWVDLEIDFIRATLEKIDDSCRNSARDLLGLLGAVYRYTEEPDFPKELLQEIKEVLLKFAYVTDQAGIGDGAVDYCDESDTIIRYACETLAGQLLSDEKFLRTDRRGEWHRDHGRELVLSWLVQRGRNGFRLWDSPSAFGDILFALVHLIDLSTDEKIREMSTILSDKIFFSMALNSFRGTFGSACDAADTGSVMNGRLSATAGINRLMWGMGVYNSHTAGTVALACSREYELPSLISDIARFLPEGLWSREHHRIPPSDDPSGENWEVNKVTYKTDSYLLASAQDYYPGQSGHVENIWRATMGPDAVVFVNHPVCISKHDARRPNFWRGNGILPRVAQWHNFLVGLYRLGENDPLGFTHAYFPTYAFDDYDLTDRWAFARKGDAYLALMASQGIELISEGPNALRELRSMGRENVWLCQMGLRERSGTFEDFRDNILSLEVESKGLSVHCLTLEGQTVSFDWEGPFMVDGKAQDVSNFKHYDSPFCVSDLPAKEMDIRFGEWLMRLDFST